MALLKKKPAPEEKSALQTGQAGQGGPASGGETKTQTPASGLPIGKKDPENMTIKEKETLLKAEELYRKGVVSIRDLVAPEAFQVTPDHIQLNNRLARSIFVTTYPRFLATGWFMPVLNLNQSLDIAFYVNPVDSERVLKILKNKVGQIESTISAERDKGAVRDPMLETALNDVEELRDRLVQGTERFFHVALYITIYANDTKDLEHKTKDIEGLLGHKLVYSRRAVFQSEQGFVSTLPLGMDQINVVNSMNTSPLSTIFPFVSSELSSDHGVLYGINQHNYSLIIFDRFSLPNANSVVFATSGAGKSYTVKLEILRSMMFGTDVIVIDPENEYKFLAEAVGGTFLRVSLDSKYRINPFDLPKKVEDMTTGDIIKSAVINLKALMRLMLGRLTREEDALVDKALFETYAKKDITDRSNLADAIPPTMQDFQEILESMEGTKDLVLRIKKYTEGTFAGLFNQPTNISLDNQLVVFSIRDLEEELRPIAMHVVIAFIWNIVRSQSKKRILVVDEAWWMMQYEDSARFMFSIAKRGRKYYLGLTTISQDVMDFLTSDYGKAVVTNSSLQILLKQAVSNVDILAKTFSLSEEERYILQNCSVGEGLFFAGNRHVAIQVVASYQEDQIITSDPRQLLEIEKAKKEYSAEQKTIA